MYVILVCRFFQGVGAGNTAVIQSFVAEMKGTNERTRNLANLNMVGNLGFIIGPAFGAFLTLFHFEFGPIKIEPFSSPGYFTALFGLINLCLIIFLFQENKIKSRGGIIINKEKVKSNPWSSRPQGFYIVIFLMILIYACFFTNLAVYDTLATYISMNLFGWKLLYTSILWICISIVSSFAYFSLNFINKFSNDTSILIASLGLQIVGIVIILPLWDSETPLWRFLVGTGFVSFGFPLSQVELIATYSKLLGTGKQGTMMGFLVAGGSAARMIGPLWSTFTYEHIGYTFVFTVVAILLGIALIISFTLKSLGFTDPKKWSSLETKMFQVQ